MTVMEDKIVNTILSDDELLNYVEKLVSRRLPAGPHLKSDYNWYKQVIDLSINQAFDDLQVVDTLNYQISQLGKYLKKKSRRENQTGNEENYAEIENSNDDTRNVDLPNFSSSEPIQRTRKQLKDSANKINHDNNGNYSDRSRQKDIDNLQDDDHHQDEKLETQQGINGRPAPDQKAQGLIQSNVGAVHRSSNRPVHEKIENESPSKPLALSTSYSSELNSLQEPASNYKKFLAISSNTENKAVPSDADVNDNDFSLKVKSSCNTRGVVEYTQKSPARYSNFQPLSGANSLDSCFEDDEVVDIRNAILKVKSPLIPTLTAGGSYISSKNSIKNSSSSQEADDGGDMVFLSPAVVPSDPTLRGAGQGDVSLCESQADSNATGDEGHDSENEGERENDQGGAGAKKGRDRANGRGSAERSVDDDIDGKGGADEELYYDSDFDDNKEENEGKDREEESRLVERKADSKGPPLGTNGSYSMPSDSVNRVRFVPDVVSVVFIIREKHSLLEVPTLFYTHDESIQFTSDYNRESLKAEAVGLTWYEWWEHRTEEDVLRDEAELLEEVEYDSDSDCINDDVSEGPDDFHF